MLTIIPDSSPAARAVRSGIRKTHESPGMLVGGAPAGVVVPVSTPLTETPATRSVADRLRALALQRAISWRGILLRPPTRKPTAR